MKLENKNTTIEKDNFSFKLLKKMISFAGLIASLYLLYKGYRMGIFSDEKILSEFLARLGPVGPLIFILLHVIRTVTKIVPASILLTVGVLIFGNLKGYIYNIIGGILGSIILFGLSRRYGSKLVKKLIGSKKYNKMLTYLKDDGKFKNILTLILVLPLAPADIFCLIAGLSDIKFKDFVVRLVLAKPISVFFYTKALLYGYSSIVPMLKNKFA